MRSLILQIIAAGLLIAGTHAQASCLGLGCACTVSASPMVMGSYNPITGTKLESTANVTVSCTALVTGASASYVIGLSTGGATSYAGRRLASGSNLLTYNLYTDSGYGTIWGNGTGTTVTVPGSFAFPILTYAGSRTHTIYGRVDAGQSTAVPGTGYTDTITVTVTY